MSDWIDKLTSALWTFGYQTLRAGEVSDAQVQAIGAEQQRQRDARVGVAQDGNWAEVPELVQHMRAVGVYSVSFRFEYVLHLVLGCVPVRGVALAQVTEFAKMLAPGCTRCRGVAAGEAQRRRQDRADRPAAPGRRRRHGGVADREHGGRADRGGLPMLFPVHDAGPAFIAQWKSTDLVSEPVSDPSYRCWLWTIEDDAVYPSGHGFAEAGRDNWRGHIAAPDDLARALRGVAG